MDQVNQAQRVFGAEIDRLLGLAKDGWEGVLEVAAEWEEWEYDGRLTFIVDHGLTEMHLRELENSAKQGAMTSEQLDRFSRLKALVAEARPVLESLPLGPP